MMINYDVKFITCDETLYLKNSDSKSYKYETKKRSEESLFDAGKRSYCERRGGDWRPTKPRQIKQLEGKLRDKTIVKTTWTTDSLITIVFSSGVIAYLTVKLNSLDVTQVLFDRYFVGKLASPIVTNVALCKSHVLFTHNDRAATLVSFGKPNSGEPCRITDRDPTLHSIELGGGSRRTERYLSHCDTATGSRILVWSTTAAEPAPWSPVIEDSANLHLYEIIGNNMSLLAYHQLENETLTAELSQNEENVIHIVEQIGCQKNNISIEWSTYEVGRLARAGQLPGRAHAVRAALPAAARAVRLLPARLLVASLDGSLHVVHQVAGITHSTKAGFIATEVQWVGELIVAAEEGGRIQCFDRALSLLHHHTKCFELSSYLREPRRLQVLCSRGGGGRGRGSGIPVLLTCFEGGPLSLLRISHPLILTAWIRSGRMCNAVALLRAMDWDEQGTECLWALNRIVCAALRSGPESIAEEYSVQTALGTFLAPAAPLSQAALRFAQPVTDLARKFFHHLLRRGRLEKALSLSVELSAWDLCRDAGGAARRALRPALQAEAAQLARHYAACDAGGAARRALRPALQAEAAQLARHYAACDAGGAARRALRPALQAEAAQLARHYAACDAGGAARRALRPALQAEAAQLARHYAACDAGGAARRALRPALQAEAAQLARHYAAMDRSESECSDSCSECSSHYTNSEAETSASSEVKTVPPPLPRVSLPSLLPVPVAPLLPVPVAPSLFPTPVHTIRPNLHQYLDRDDTIWNTEIKDNIKTTDNLKSILTTQHSKWNENGIPTFKALNNIDIIPRTNEDRATGSQFRHVFQNEFREENVPNTLYRYQNNNYPLKDRMFVNEHSDRQGSRVEKNKVKFSDTVTVAVMSASSPELPSPSRELAASLPLCAPHKYLAAFAPQAAPPAAAPPGTTLDYVEV